MNKEPEEQWCLIYKGVQEFKGTRQEVSAYALSHGLSRYYRGKRVLNLGVEIEWINPAENKQPSRDPISSGTNS